MSTMRRGFKSRPVWLFVVFFLPGLAGAQPYNYFIVDKNVSPINSDVYRTDLSTGTSQVVITDVGNITNLFVFPDQSRLFLTFRSGVVEVAETDDFSRRTQILSGVDWVYDLVDAPSANRIFLLVGTIDESRWIITLDRSTYAVLDSITDVRGEDYPMLLSGDGGTLYAFEPDSGTTEPHLISIQTSTSRLIGRVPFVNMGPSTQLKTPVDGRAGNILIAYEYPAAGIQNQYYADYDLATGVTHTAVHFPWIADAYLSSDGKYIILNRRIPIITDSAAHEGYDEYPGTVYVFDASTGTLTQRLSLPSGGKILVFDSYPQMFYYYNDSTNQSLPVNVTVVTPTSALLDTLISMKHQAVAKSWLRDDRDRGHDIEDMMRGNEWYNKGEFKKFRRWEVGKDWDFDHDWNNGIVEVLDKRLDMAKRTLSHGDSVMARRNLEIFVMEVELLNNLSGKLVKRGKEPVITSDGYLSLKFNAEYLIDRLPDRHGRGDEGGDRGKK